MAESQYWADQVAKKVLKIHPRKKIYIVAAGVTPSGRKHIGNYREIITNAFVAKALEDSGKKVKFIYSWDSFDRFRKVPKDLPKDKIKFLEKYIGMPDSDVPDPFGCHKNYARHYEEFLEKESAATGVYPKFIYQDKEFRNCTYAKEIRTLMRGRIKVAEVLNRSRKEPLPKKWYPLFVYCEKCNRDSTKILNYDEEYTITYKCSDCNFQNTVDFSKVGIVKPPWRPDWAARWVHYNEAFESAGKDHMVKGSSFDSASAIVKEVFKDKPPHGIMYDFVRQKGMGGKMSASKGYVITVEDALSVYLPEIVRFFFAGTKPNKEFVIPFDEEILKVYEDFFKTERIYYGKEKASERDKAHWSRVYEMSSIKKIPKTMPLQPGFRHCVELINIHKDPDRAFDKVLILEGIKKEFDKQRYKLMLECAKNWLDNYAPDKYKFEIQTKPKMSVIKSLNKEEKHVLIELAKNLKEREWTESELYGEFGALCSAHKLEFNKFFKSVYRALLNKERGPRLAPFILAIGKDKVASILEKVK